MSRRGARGHRYKTGRSRRAARPIRLQSVPIRRSRGYRYKISKEKSIIEAGCRSANGTYSLRSLDCSSRAVLRRAGDVLDSLNLPNLREDKPVGVAAHWRGLPEAEAESIHRYIRDAWTSLLGEAQLELHSFDGGLELRAKGRNKGSVVTDVLAGHAGDAAVAYLGDDLTDEDAFRALAGKGLRVLVRSTLRDTLADVWLRPPDELIDFLVSWKDACSWPVRP